MAEKRGGVCNVGLFLNAKSTLQIVAQAANDGHEQKRHNLLEEPKKQVLEYHVSCLYEDGIAEPVVEL